MRRFYQIVAAAGIVGFLSLAGFLAAHSFADTFGFGTEAEAGTLDGTSARCQDATASSSSSVKFGAVTCSPETRQYTNPVTVAADPGVIKWDSHYYLVGTAGSPTFPISVSDDLVNWQPTGKSIFNGTHPWGTDRFWAPEIHRVGNRFAAYYSAAGSDGRLAVGVATADNILGPYTDLGQPLVHDSVFGVIDVNFFRDDDGRQYLYWKEDQDNTRIFGQEIDQAGTTLIGTPTAVLQKDLAWEGTKGIEAPWVTKKGGQYYMFYSGNLYNTASYAIGVARSSSPLTVFTKRGDPIVKSGVRWIGPGHNSVVPFGANDYMVYHAWDRAVVGNRQTLVDKITWAADGWPSVGTGQPTETILPYPQ